MAGTIETPVQQICEFLKLVSRGGVFETRLLRCKTRSGRPFTMSGYRNDPLAAAEDLVEADQEYEAAASYVTLNAINPALLSRASNRLKRYPENTTSNADVVKRTRLGNGRSRPRLLRGGVTDLGAAVGSGLGGLARQCLNRHDRLASPRRLCPGRLSGAASRPGPQAGPGRLAGHLRLCRASQRRPLRGGRGGGLRRAGVLLITRRSASPAAFSGRPAARFRGPSPAKEPSGCSMAVCGLAGNCVGRSDARGCSWPRPGPISCLGSLFLPSCSLAKEPRFCRRLPVLGGLPAAHGATGTPSVPRLAPGRGKLGGVTAGWTIWGEMEHRRMRQKAGLGGGPRRAPGGHGERLRRAYRPLSRPALRLDWLFRRSRLRDAADDHEAPGGLRRGPQVDRAKSVPVPGPAGRAAEGLRGHTAYLNDFTSSFANGAGAAVRTARSRKWVTFEGCPSSRPAQRLCTNAVSLAGSCSDAGGVGHRTWLGSWVIWRLHGFRGLGMGFLVLAGRPGNGGSRRRAPTGSSTPHCP